MKKGFNFIKRLLKCLVVLFLLCSFNKLQATPSATISGTATICNGGSTTLSVALSGGTAPYKFTWTDGTTHHSVTGVSSSPYTFSVSPTVNTTYTIVSDSDTYNTNGYAIGSAIITVQMPAGTYTINPSGSGATNYTTFNAALTDLENRGICGAVNFNVSNGTYNEQVIIPTITGSSATNTITFQSASGDSAAVILTDTSSSTAGAGNCTLCMNGGSYITFNKLTIQRTGTKTNAVVISQHSGGSSHNVNYTNNRIICGSTTSLNIYGMKSDDTMYVFSHNYIQGGSDGIEWFSIGAKGFVFEYNTVTDFAAGGVVFEDLVNPLVLGNTITQPQTSSTTGIAMNGGNIGSLVEKNIIYLNKEGTGINEYVDSATSANPNTIANNFITIGDTLLSSNTGGTGIHSNNSQYENIYYNSINIVDKKLSTTSLGLYFTNSVAHSCHVNVENNIVSTTSGGLAVNLNGTDASYYVVTCNYNDYYTRGTYIGNYSNTNKTTLASWQSATGKDANSINVKPLYITDTTNLYTFNPALKVGTSLSLITDDINGNTRSTTTPDMGASEFAATSISTTSGCANSGETYSTPSHSGSTYAWTVSGGTISGSSTSNSVTINWGSAGAGSLKIKETNGLYKDSATATITVNAAPAANAGSPSTYCNGGSASIGTSSVGGDTYSWSSSPSGYSSTVSNPTVSPTTTNTYALTETITATGCTKSNTVVITVNPLPTASAGSNTTICNHSSTTIGASSISGQKYSWASTPSGFTSSIANPTVSPTTTTTYTLKDTITATGCTNSNSVVITVHPSPVKIGDSSNALICKGDTVEIGDDTVSGYSYSWSASPSGATPTGAYGLVEPTLTTTYLLTKTITATGCSTTDSILVTVDPGPAANAGSNQTICGGSTANIGGTAVSGNQYIWLSNPPGYNSDTSSPTVSPTVTTTYYLYEIAPAGCEKSDSVVITVHPVPAANVGTDSIITDCDAGYSSISIGATAISGHTYAWTSSPSGFTSTSANPTVTPSVNTTYTLTETITADGCTNTNSIHVTLKPSNSHLNFKVHLTQTN